MRTKIILTFISGIVLGLLIGGYLFTGVQQRSVFALVHCQSECLSPNDLTGLLMSVDLQKVGVVPLPIVFESNKIVVVQYPKTADWDFHEVIIPKKDIKDITQVTPADEPYLEEVYTYVAQTVAANHLTKYKLITNGPGYQEGTYLHFHLVADFNK